MSRWVFLKVAGVLNSSTVSWETKFSRSSLADELDGLLGSLFGRELKAMSGGEIASFLRCCIRGESSLLLVARWMGASLVE